MRKIEIKVAGMTPLGQHFALGRKDLLAMEFAECASSVDKDMENHDLQGPWPGAIRTTDGCPPGNRDDTLRSTAHNQVGGARIALAHNIGGPTAVSAVTILEGPGADGR